MDERSDSSPSPSCGLPNVMMSPLSVEYGWSEEEFLEHTCEKAGLAKNFWRYNEMEISKFQGIIFKEEEPNGRIIKASLCDRL